jgi:nucleotide-binding universal stress UspA family protein
MFKTILVPLDGSPLSEKALPAAVSIARRANGSLRLVTVLVPKVEGWTQAIREPHDVKTVLDLVAHRVREAAPGVTVDTDLLEGQIAETLAARAADVRADLIVATTHGRGALSRFWLGSVTDELLRRAPVPVLVVRPGEDKGADVAAEIPVRRVLVPLDGSPGAEAALGPATALARLYGAGLELLHVVSPMPAIMPGNPATLAAEEVSRQAQQSLNRVAERLRQDGLAVTTRVVIYDRVAAAVLEQAGPDDVIALATNARRGVARWVLGSVADKLVRASEVPVLVVGPGGG